MEGVFGLMVWFTRISLARGCLLMVTLLVQLCVLFVRIALNKAILAFSLKLSFFVWSPFTAHLSPTPWSRTLQASINRRRALRPTEAEGRGRDIVAGV